MNSEFKYLFEQELISIIEKNNNGLILPNDQDELEIRFGKLQSGKFNSDIGIENFTNVFNRFKDNGEKQIIFDWVHRNEILRDFNSKFQRLVRRQTIKSNLDLFDEIDFNKYDHRRMTAIPSKKELEFEREVKITDTSSLSSDELKVENESAKERVKYIKE